ncbi:hypothetical protein EV693_11531 [Nicoletella semolina]|uniref:Esterase n=1 Tax=Nicoletella semolina TaxID=271160 RepID=A0A4R2N5B2_9PAST|nr:alpha/beta hydrolase [Nicoletella semolina]MDH2924778.1 esterase [Nicoletella semolina]TCP15995.1 hypothetical protein EV693_11531 [Nicoletella semolina]
MAQVYVVHGYTASAQSHWFGWLKTELEKIGVVCECLTMPDSDNPTPQAWLEHLGKQVHVDDQTIVIGHSLGGLAWLNFLSQAYLTPRGAIFVSGFYQSLPSLPELTTFSNLYAISPSLMPFKSYVVASLDDSIVPHQYSDALAVHLQADYIRLPTGGHFLDREGWTTFPLVLELVKKLLP